MGIKGLTSLLAGPLSAAFDDEPLPRGALLLIDGNGWVWSILSEADAADASGDGAARAALGDYAAIDAAAARAIGRLRAAGHEVHVYFDGRPSTGATAEAAFSAGVSSLKGPRPAFSSSPSRDASVQPAAIHKVNAARSASQSASQ